MGATEHHAGPTGVGGGLFVPFEMQLSCSDIVFCCWSVSAAVRGCAAIQSSKSSSIERRSGSRR